jgi:Zn-dependent alcohol dehydrogenase
MTAIPPDFDLKVAPLSGQRRAAQDRRIGRNLRSRRRRAQPGAVRAVRRRQPVIAVDLLDQKLALARERGATHCINAQAGAIRAVAGGKPDKVIETTGVKSVIELAYELTPQDGRGVLVGVPSEKVSIYTLPIHFKKVLTGSHGGNARPHIDIPRIIRLIEAGRLSFDGIITHEFPFAEINAVLDLVRSSKAGRVLVDVAAVAHIERSANPRCMIQDYGAHY